MKRIFCLLCAFAMLFLLCACKDKGADAQSQQETATMKTYISKDSVNEFMELLDGETDLGGLSGGYVLDKTHCYNVTPPQVAAETNMKIFKFSDSCASFVVVDNYIYELCVSFGGYGFVNAVPCDFDNDGNKDLLVASSWGSGVHRSIISIFNSVTKESTVLYNTSSTDNPDVDLFVSITSPSLSSIDSKDLPIYYDVYSAKITVNDANFVDLSYVATGLVGTIQVENDTPVFVPYSN